MLASVVGVGEASGGLDNDLGAYRLPIDFGRILFGKDLEGATFYLDGVGAGGDLVIEVAEHRIVLQKMSQSFRIGQVIHRYELKIRVVQRSAQNIATDASKSIDTYFDCHLAS